MYTLEDIDIEVVKREKYDIAFFSCGYEERSRYLSNIVSKKNIKKACVMGFSENEEKYCRIENNAMFKDLYNEIDIKLSVHDVFALSGYLQTLKIKKVYGDEISILLDYSSMPRAWYGFIIYFLRTVSYSEKININVDLVYSHGIYQSKFEKSEISPPKVIPGCEGTSLTKPHSATIFLLGFESNLPLFIYNKINPEVAYGAIARPASKQDYVKEAKRINEDFIRYKLDDSKRLFEIPIHSVRRTFESLSEVITPLRKEHNITIAPFGPKPHVLSSIICSLKYPEVSCIYASPLRNPVDVKCSGNLTSTRLSIKNKKNRQARKD